MHIFFLEIMKLENRNMKKIFSFIYIFWHYCRFNGFGLSSTVEGILRPSTFCGSLLFAALCYKMDLCPSTLRPSTFCGPLLQNGLAALYFLRPSVKKMDFAALYFAALCYKMDFAALYFAALYFLQPSVIKWTCGPLLFGALCYKMNLRPSRLCGPLLWGLLCGSLIFVVLL